MKILRAILSGVITWILIFILWPIIMVAPVLKDLGNWQYLIHYVALVPIVVLGAFYYYKSGNNVNGFILGLVMLATGQILDAAITVPFFIIPQGSGYAKFFINPLIWVGFVEFVLITYIYWVKKVRINFSNNSK